MQADELLCIANLSGVPLTAVYWTCFLIYKFEFMVRVVEVVDKQYISLITKNLKTHYRAVQCSAMQCSAVQFSGWQSSAVIKA